MNVERIRAALSKVTDWLNALNTIAKQAKACRRLEVGYRPLRPPRTTQVGALVLPSVSPQLLSELPATCRRAETDQPIEPLSPVTH